MMEGAALAPLKTKGSQQEQDAVINTAPPQSPWVLGLCSVLFDVDKGQTLQDLWPLDCLSEAEQSAVAFHAFPDSLSMELYTRNAVKDSSFTFRIKRDPESYSSAGVPEFLYGYVFCRQRQDETLRRGGEQVSVLVLSISPFSGALLPLSHAAGHAFFNEGPLALAMIYNQVLSWPLPVPGSSMCLPIGAAVINTRLPHFSIMPPPQPAVDPAVQATLSRRTSRALSLKASGSPRLSAAMAAASAATAASNATKSSTQDEVPAAGDERQHVGSAADAEPAGTAATQPQQPQQQQDKEPQAGSSGGGLQPAGEDAGLTGGAKGASSPRTALHTLPGAAGPATATTGAGSASDGPANAAAAADDSGWAIVGEESPAPQQQQQQQQPRGMSSGGSFSSLLGLSFTSSGGSSSQAPKAETSAAGEGSMALAGSRSSSSNGAVAASSSSSGVGSEWLASTLGQQWRDEKPFPEVEPALVLAPLLRDLWTVWQLVVTGQPLMVVGLNPGETSAATAALVSLIAPLPYAADFRPFFTIHDPDFVAMAAGQLPKRQQYHEVLPEPQEPMQQLPAAEQQHEGPQQQQSQHQQEEEEGLGCQSEPQAPPAAAQPQSSSPAMEGQQHQQQQEQQQDAQQQVQQLDSQPPPPPPQQQQQQQQLPLSKAGSASKHISLPALIGVTNLYFIRALPKWPNVVAVSRKEMLTPPPSNTSRGGSPARPAQSTGGAATPSPNMSAGGAVGTGGITGGGAAAGASPAGAAAANGLPPSSPPVAPAGGRSGSSGFFYSTAAAAMRALQRRHQGPQHLLSHFAPHLWTCGKHWQCVKPDHTLLSKARAVIEPAVGSAGGIAAAAAAGGGGGGSGSCAVLGPGSPAGTAAARLRRHFAELTAALLAPFEMYFTPGPTGKVPAWRPEAFLASLSPAALPPVLTARLAGNSTAAAAALYAAFIESPNFAFWFAQRRAPVLHLVEEEPESDDEGFAEVVHGGDDSSDAGEESEPDEVELVQQLLSIEQALTDLQQQQLAGGQQQADARLQQQEQVLQFQLVQAFRQLPRDVQAALFSSPPRQELLQDAAAALAAGSCAEQEAAAGVLQKMQELMISASSEHGDGLSTF